MMAPRGLRIFSRISLFIFLNMMSDASTDTKHGRNDMSVNEVMMTTQRHSIMTDGGCDCGPYSSKCSLKNGQLICYCHDGYAQTNSTPRGRCERCSCGPHGDRCEFLGGLQICICENGIDTMTGECLPSLCDCGENGRCSYEDGIKVCHCHYGFEENGGKCEECDCGDGTCEFMFGMKRCDCRNNLVESNGKCRECDCGENSISCTLGSIFRRRICICKDGYAVSKLYDFSDESCKECDCGSNGVSCSFSNENMFLEEQTCKCRYGSNLKTERKGKKCKECDCGAHSRSCRFNSGGERRCECEEGYKSSKALGDEYCSSIVKEGVGGGGGGNNVSGWRIGTYILLATFTIVIVMSLAIAVLNKNTNQSETSLPRMS